MKPTAKKFIGEKFMGENLHNANFRTGVSALIAVIVITAMALILATTSSLIGIDVAINGQHQKKARETFAGADGCMEVTLQTLKNNHGYTGGALTIGNVNCTATVTGTGTTRSIRIQADINNKFTKDIETNVNWASGFQINAWHERND